MREIILDTETTGISVKEGHRIVEIDAWIGEFNSTKINFTVTRILKKSFKSISSSWLYWWIFIYSKISEIQGIFAIY